MREIQALHAKPVSPLCQQHVLIPDQFAKQPLKFRVSVEQLTEGSRKPPALAMAPLSPLIGDGSQARNQGPEAPWTPIRMPAQRPLNHSIKRPSVDPRFRFHFADG